jgi:integrase
MRQSRHRDADLLRRRPRRRRHRTRRPRYTIHDLRHSYATGALKAGVSSKVVSDRIGHANVGFLLQTYAHVLGNDDRDAAEQAASFLIGDEWDLAEEGAADDCQVPVPA